MSRKKKLKESLIDMGRLMFTNAQPSFKTGIALTQEEARALNFGAFLSSKNDMPFDTIELYGKEQKHKDILEDFWGVTDAESAKNTLEWLVNEGHRTTSQNYGFNDIFQVYRGISNLSQDEINSIKQNYTKEFAGLERLEEILKKDFHFSENQLNSITTVSAWDFDRLVTVARWCNTSAYISRKEAWNYIYRAAVLGVEEYSDWEFYLAATVMGRVIWSQSDEIDSYDLETMEELLSKSGSLYKKYPFNLEY